MGDVSREAADPSDPAGRPCSVKRRRTKPLLLLFAGLLVVWWLTAVLQVSEIRRVEIPYNGGFEGPQRFRITRALYLSWGNDAHELMRWTGVGE